MGRRGAEEPSSAEALQWYQGASGERGRAEEEAERGGEQSEALEERLTLTTAIPLAGGVPPADE